MNDLEKIKQLRQSTGAGFKDCNNALKESNGDLDKAVEILRVKGISKASKKMSRIAKEGVIALSGDQKKTSVLEVNCETDFVAKNNDFIDFVKELGEINNSVNSDLNKLNQSLMKNKKTVQDNVVSIETKENIESVKSFGKQLAMHVAASNPLALEANDIDNLLLMS